MQSLKAECKMPLLVSVQIQMDFKTCVFPAMEDWPVRKLRDSQDLL